MKSMCDNFCRKLKVEISQKNDCISFIITSKNNFKKTLLASYQNVSSKMESKSKLQKFADTAGAEVMREQCRCLVLRSFFEILLWMNPKKIIDREFFFFKVLENPNVSLLKWNSHYNSCVFQLTKIRPKLHNKAERSITHLANWNMRIPISFQFSLL